MVVGTSTLSHGDLPPSWSSERKRMMTPMRRLIPTALVTGCLCASSLCAQYYAGRGYNPLTGTTAAAQGVRNPYTGGYAERGAAYNPYTGGATTERAGYNPATGREGASKSYYNPTTGTTAHVQGAYNPYTGKYAYHYNVRR